MTFNAIPNDIMSRLKHEINGVILMTIANDTRIQAMITLRME